MHRELSLTRASDCHYIRGRTMLREPFAGGAMLRGAKAFHGLIGFGLLICMACPDIEILCHSTDCIFLSGHDIETSVALFLLIVELTFVALKMAVPFLPRLLGWLAALSADPMRFDRIAFAAVSPTTSPPLPLRI